MYWLLIRESTERVDTQRYPLAVNGPPRLPAGPRLQQFPRNELLRLPHERRRGGCTATAGVDKNAGIVHIPIEDAMRLMLERGALTTRPVDGVEAAAAGGHVSVGFELRAGAGKEKAMRRLGIEHRAVVRIEHSRATRSRAGISPARLRHDGAGHACYGAPAAARGRHVQAAPQHQAATRRAFKDDNGRPVTLGQQLRRQAAGRPRVRLLQLPDALHAGDERRLAAP
mgnify:CR=1 FL=1